MTFKDIPVAISYKSTGEDCFSQILNPLLKCAKEYKRCVGFFSSSALDFIGDGVLSMAKNGGRIYLATCPRLSDEDIQAIYMGYKEREILSRRFIEEVEDALKYITDENALILYQLIKERVLDVKIVLKDKGIYHDKLALIKDVENNTIAFVGSNNETGAGYNSNYEKIRVYKSWTDIEGRIQDETEEFESIWNNSNEHLKIFDFMNAFEEKVLERVRKKGVYKKENIKYEIRPYQDEAKKNWNNNGGKGFFVMATGTGKTITSLYSIQNLLKEEKIFTVIAVPYKHLANQWYEDVKVFFPEAYVHIVHGEIKDAETKIFTSYCLAKKNYKPVIVITTIKSFFLNRFTELYDKVNYDKLLIVDEAHNFYNKLSDELSEKYRYKLGLSATPVFGNNQAKTDELLAWFGGKVMDFPIEKAIGKYLVNYEYHPIIVYATDNDEEKFNKAHMLMLSAIDQESGIIIDEDKFTIGYRGRLRAISMAEEKIGRIREIFSEVDDTDHTIVYCSDGRMLCENINKKNEVEEIRHLEFVLNLINQSIAESGMPCKASKFTASEDAQTRMDLIDRFNKGYINYLVAIKCLDEGINIPSIKSALILSSNDNYREFVQRRGRILRLYEDEYGKKQKAHIYDVIVLPSIECTTFAQIELRRFYEYARLALNKDVLLDELHRYLEEYNLSMEEIMFDNDYVYGGDLDE